MREQLQNQLKSVETLFRFSVHETGMSITYMNFKKSISRALAQVSLMVDMLKKDLELCGVKAADFSLPELLKELVEKEVQVRIDVEIS